MAAMPTVMAKRNATGALNTTLGFMAGLVIIIFLGITIPAEPQTYRRGIEHVFPPYLRTRTGCVMGDVGRALPLVGGG